VRLVVSCADACSLVRFLQVLSSSVEHVLRVHAVEAIGLAQHGVLDPDEKHLFVHGSDLAQLAFKRRVLVLDPHDCLAGDHIVLTVHCHEQLALMRYLFIHF
jgi:hypothetical protein